MQTSSPHSRVNYSFEFHTLYYPNTPSSLSNAHKSVMSHFEIPVQYTVETINHGIWMNKILDETTSDFICFFDADCVPITLQGFQDSIQKALQLQTFIGIAQASNHKQGFENHIFAAPGFLIVKKEIYENFGKPNMMGTHRSDAAQELSHLSDERNIPYGLIYPTHYEFGPKENQGNPWRLGNYGYFGIGTIYDNICYHLYQGRMQQNIQLFQKRCNQIIQGEFTSEGMNPCKKESHHEEK